MKFTTSEVKKKLATINQNVRILGNYLNSGSPLLCLCKQCKHKWSPTWDSLKQGVGCPRCAALNSKRKQSLTICEVRAKLRTISPTISITGGIYENSLSILECTCQECKHSFKSNWSKLGQGYGCPICWHERIAKKQRLSLLAIKTKLQQISPDIEILATSYRSNDQPLACRCQRCLHEWSPPWQTLRLGVGCPKCNRSNPSLTNAEVQQQIQQIHPQVTMVGQYNGYGAALECKCNACDYNFTTSLYNVRRYKSGCPRCTPSHYSEEEVRAIIERVTGKLFPKATPNQVPWLHGLTLDGFCQELVTPKFPNGTAFERQGEQHYQLVNFGGHKDTAVDYKRRRRNDLRKIFQCRYHGVRLIRIPYWVKDVETYLSKRLTA